MVDTPSDLRSRAIAVSSAVADFLCRKRLSYEDQSTWLGTSQHRDASGEMRFTLGTLGPGLYGGVSGIALFLAETGAKTGNREFGDVAASSIVHAMSRTNAIPRKMRFGFFTGLPGIAYSAIRIGELLDRADILQKGQRILRSLTRESTSGSLLDLISGAAGSAPVILDIADRLNDEDLRRLSRRLGLRMVARAQKKPGGWSWGQDAIGFESARNLTGFAHGAAGFGWSLLELDREPADPTFARGARQAFRYERRWFQKQRMNWPDFRETQNPKRAPCRIAWCHGAPGIGMSRLVGWYRHGDEAYRTEIAAAIRSSSTLLDPAIDQLDYSLCHGVFGVAEFLLMAGRVPGARSAAFSALSLVASSIDEYGDRPGEWPCGLERGWNPSLMTGLAGIGYFYLRLAWPDVPSVLLPGRRTDGLIESRQRRESRVRPRRAESSAQRREASA